MTQPVPIFKDENNERPIPTVWRKTFIDVVEAFKDGDFQLERGVDGVQPLPPRKATAIAVNIKAYGDQLICLPNETWQTSIYRWMRDYWEVFIDLYTAQEGASDLVLFTRVHENDGLYSFEIQSVHVP